MAASGHRTNLTNPLLSSSTKGKLSTQGSSHGATTTLTTTTTKASSTLQLHSLMKSPSSTLLGSVSGPAKRQDLLVAGSTYSSGLRSDLTSKVSSGLRSDLTSKVSSGLRSDLTSKVSNGLRSDLTSKVSTTGKLAKITAFSREELMSGQLKMGVSTSSRPTAQSHGSLRSLSAELPLTSGSSTRSNVSLTGPAASTALLCPKTLRGLGTQLTSQASHMSASPKVSTTHLLLTKPCAGTGIVDKKSSLTSSLTTPLSVISSRRVCSNMSLMSSTLTRSSHCHVSSGTATTPKLLRVTSNKEDRTSALTSSTHKASLLQVSEKHMKTDVETTSTTTQGLQKHPTQDRANITRPITDDTEGAPKYKVSLPAPTTSQKTFQFVPPDLDASLHTPPTPAVDVVGLKTTILNAVSASLLASPDFHNSKDPTLLTLASLGEKISCHDPEFVLKLAIYTRLNLNIRTTANFLLALAAKLPSCRPYLKKYFCATIRLPSDWIEVAEIYQALHDTTIKFGSIPTALRKVMAAKFTEFDAYQLAKYNKDGSKKKKINKEREKMASMKSQKLEEEKKKKYSADYPSLRLHGAEESESDTEDSSDSSVVLSDSENKEEIERMSFTLKQLIRKIHISGPVEHIMCLVGKKYPEDSEAFRKTRLTGMWDQDRAGKRMKLPTPETWETQVSTKGNRASTWQDLIDHKKLPFMAMLRNIRNLIIAGVSAKHHQWVIKKLGDEREVVKSKQFPFRFFSAYQVLEELEKIESGEAMLSKAPRKGKGKKSKKPPKKMPDIDHKLLHRYKTALDTALKIATCYNVKPIGGSTLILCNVGSNMNRPCTAARGLGKPRKVLEVGILLGLMCKYSSENSTMLLYGHNGASTKVDLEDGTILHNMERVMATATSENLTSRISDLPISFLTEFLKDRTQVDNIVLLSDTMKLDDEQGRMMMDFLQKYRHLVNPNLLFVSVDLSAGKSEVSSTIQAQHPNDIYLAGYSDQILRFIAERGDSGQLTYVDNIDRVYDLSSVKVPSLADSDITDGPHHLSSEKTFLSITRGQKWREIRIFISSTFRDMHGERDMLTRFVFPELRARAHSKQIHVYEVDLRWGITEQATRSHKALEICLDEISRSQYFIGLLGQRYGWVPDEYNVSNTPDFDWLKHYPTSKSITEVEMYHAALRDTDKAVKKAFFYFRDPSFLNKVPAQFKDDFESESEEAIANIESLKSNIRESGLEVYDNYPCCWLGKIQDKPMVGGLESFGQRVLYSLWNAIQRDFSEEDAEEDAITQSTAEHTSFEEAMASTFIGRRALRLKAKEAIENPENRLVLVAGKPGCGKSAFMAALAQQYTASTKVLSVNLVLSHFVGAAPGSSNIALLLTRLCHEMKRRFGVTQPVPEDYTDLARDWPSFLEDSVVNLGTVGSKIIVMIDGVDLLEDKHNGRSLDWIPSNIPEGALLLISGVEGGMCVTNLRKRQPPPVEITIGHLDMFDRAEMVRKKLERFRKTLNESPFNNQMKLLLTKKEAINPLYLHLACEELRVFGVFEEVTAYLKKMPPTIGSLLQEILLRLEYEFPPEIISTTLLILTLVRNGLLEHELAGVLELASKELCSEEEAWSLSPMMISKLLRSLQTFLQPTGQQELNLLIMAHKDIEKAVKLRYMRGAESRRGGKLHLLLSKFFMTEVDPASDGSFKGNSARAFVELPYHLKEASAWKELEQLVCNINFVVAKCQLGRAHQLLEDYMPIAVGLQAGKSLELNKFIQHPAVQEFKSFTSRNLHVLLHNPSLALQQALNEPDTSTIARSAKDLAKKSHSMMVWLNKPDTISPCQMNISSLTGSVLCVDVSLDSSLFTAGFKNGAVKLYEVATGKEVHTFIGHAAGIADVCFVSSDLVCSASHDATLSLWHTKQGIRVTSMRGHHRGVYGCAANRSGKSIVSVSWDTSIKVWDRTGKLQSTLMTKGQHNTPINCVSFHPEGQLVVVGSWDASLKIWDTFNQKRLKVLKGHRSSVQACAYAPSGRHIVSASLDGEVKVWSTKSGTAVGTIIGHHSPINGIAFTPNGQYLVTGSSDKVVKVWSGTMGQPVTSIGCEQLGAVHKLVFNHHTQLVDVGYHDGHVRQFNLQTGAEVFSVRLHRAAIVGLAHHINLFMSASADGSMKVWDSDHPHKAIQLKGHSTSITCAVWDKNGFASASEDFTIMVWRCDINVYNRKISGKPVAVRKKDKKKVQPTPQEGKQLDLEEKPLFQLQGQHTGRITSIAFSCDGLRMAVAGHDQKVTLWDCLSHQLVKTLNNCHKDWITACSFSDKTSNLLFTGSTDFTLKVWDLTSGVDKRTFTGHMSAINSISVSQGCVVSSATDGSVKVWSHKGVEITTMFCHKQRVNTCHLHIPSTAKANQMGSSWADIDDLDDSTSNIKLEEIVVLTGSDDGTVGVWKPFLPNEIATLTGHSDGVLSVATTLNNHVLSSSLDGSIRMWKFPLPASALTLVSTSSAHTGPVTSLSGLSAREELCYVVSGGRDGHVILWKIEGSGFKKMYQMKDSDTAVSSVCLTKINNDSKSGEFAVGGNAGTLSIYSFSHTKTPLMDACIKAHNLMGLHPVSKLVQGPDRKNIVAGSWSAKIAAVGSNRGIVHRMDMHKDWVMDLITVGNCVYSIGLDGNLMCWEVPKSGPPPGKPVIPSSGCRFSLHLDPAGEKDPTWPLSLCQVQGTSYMAISDSKGQVTLWNKETKTVEVTKKLHSKQVNAVASVSDSCFLSGSDDNTVKAWRVEGRGRNISLTQIGQFYGQSCITSIASVGGVTRQKGKNSIPMFVVGDSLGYVNLLQWQP